MFTRRLLKIKIHSRRVLIFKRSLPIFAFLLAGIMIVWPNLSEQKDKFTARQIPETAIKNAQVDMSEVRFFSQDNKNRPMTVVAVSVQETNPEKQIITLNEPVATYTMENGTILTSKSSYALAFQKEEYLYLEEPVDTKTDDGWTAYSQKVVYDYKNGTLESDEPVEITGPEGTLTADKGFIIVDKGQEITFRGNTKTVVTADVKMNIISKNGMIIDQIKRTITANKEVVVIQDGYTVSADKMILYYTDKKNKDRVQKIEAFGNVVADNKQQKIVGQQGIYMPATGIIEMTKNVVLSQGDNKAYGDVAKLNLRTGLSSLTATKTQSKPARIKGQLIPADLK